VAEGQKKLNQITRYATVGLAAFNAVTITMWLTNLSGNVVPRAGFLFHFTGIVTLVTGTMIVMWIGEQITEHGIGNGISLIIFAGIISRYPAGFIMMFQKISAEPVYAWKAALAIVVMVAVTAAVIFVTEAIRKDSGAIFKAYSGTQSIWRTEFLHTPASEHSRSYPHHLCTERIDVPRHDRSLLWR